MSDHTPEEVDRSIQEVRQTANLNSLPPERYCRTETLKFPVGDQWQLIYSKLHGTSHLLGSHHILLLDHCRSFQTLDQHAHEWLRVYAPDANTQDSSLVGSIYEQLSQLVKAGLLVSEHDLLAQVTQGGDNSAAANVIACLGIVTRNRPDSWQRCLRSFIDNSKRHDRSNAFVVVDDSDNALDREEARQLLRSFSASDKVRVAYAGREEKQAFADRLVASGDLPIDIVNFALFDTEGCGCSIGANRNALLLHTIGDTVLSADDDMVCQVAAAPKSETSLSFDSNWELMRFWFFSDREHALQSTSFENCDVLAIHEQLLGKSLRECVATFTDAAIGLNFERINAGPLRDLRENRGRVLATFTGVVGDSGMDTPLTYLVLGRDSHERLVRFEAEYQSAFASREVLRAVKRPLVSGHAWCAAAAWGYDNRALLPPFMPVGRGEDDVWGFTAQACCRDGYFGYLPWAVVHAPPEKRRYPPAWITEAAARLCVFHIMLACLSGFQTCPGVMNEAERMQTLGRHLVAVGSMQLPDFEEYVRLYVWRMQGEYIAFLENRLQSYEGSPHYWATDVKAYIAALRHNLARKDYLIAQDLLSGRSPEEARRTQQRLVRNFGELLYWWPQITTTAKSLRAHGHRLATIP